MAKHTDKIKIVWQEEVANEPLYIQLYHYYKTLIVNGTLEAGSKLPSIRRCATERRVSRTTVEAAYGQLAAEGYIKASPGSGFYVGDLDYKTLYAIKARVQPMVQKTEEVIYDFSSARVDSKSFNFDIWRRYIKSALRNTERLLSYGDPQGEYDLRIALATYIREKRGVVCTPEQIVVGASMQTLLHMLCSLIGEPTSIAFTGNSYKQGKAIFEDRSYHIKEYKVIEDYFERAQEQPSKLIYTSPSHTTAWGTAMDMKTRMKLLEHVRKNNCLIIEDDYDSEFSYYSRPTPALQGLDGGEQVIYMSTFSKLLLPSLRLSFMVLPQGMVEAYKKRGAYYNQTASKVEQIALCQFIRDGHLEKQIKRAKKLYTYKKEQLCHCVDRVFGKQATIIKGSNGFLIQLEISTVLTPYMISEDARKKGLLIRDLERVPKQNKMRILLSCSGVAEEDFERALKRLHEVFTQ